MAAGNDGAVWLMRENSLTLEQWDGAGGAATLRIEIPFVPEALSPAPSGGVLAIGSADSVVVAASGIVTSHEPGLAAPGIRSARRLARDRGIAIVREGYAESLVLLVPDAESKRIAGPFAEIESFEVSPDEREVAFSARRGAGLDIGLVASDGSEIQWIGPDPLDERSVKWAPRGNKIAYAIETPGGTVIRSVHIPTGFQVSSSLPLAEVRDLAWYPDAERLALLVTSADAGERVEVMRYDGTERRTAVPPLFRSGAPDQLAGVPEAVLFPPDRVRYNQKVPLVVWATREGPFAWNEARARLQQNRSMGSIVVARGAASRPLLWETIAELPWVDQEKVFLVSPDVPALSGEAGLHVTVLTPGLEPSEELKRVTVVRSESAPLEEFAVLWLSERLRGFEREHDGS